MKRLLATLLLLTFDTYGQNPLPRFLLDGSRPYAYLQFDHVGVRKPIEAGEGSEGLWLRIVNNCVVPIAVGI